MEPPPGNFSEILIPKVSEFFGPCITEINSKIFYFLAIFLALYLPS